MRSLRQWTPGGERKSLQAPDSTRTSAESGTGRNVVEFTRSAARQYNRAHSSVRDVFVDVYSNALAGACVLMFAVSLLVALREQIAARSIHEAALVHEDWQVFPAELLWLLLTYLALAGIVHVARQLGPVAVSRAEGAWWLPLPVDRSAMVVPAFCRRLAAVGTAASAAYSAFSFMTATDRLPWEHAVSAATFGSGAVAAVACAAILQLQVERTRVLRPAIAVGLMPLAVLPFLAATPSLLVVGLLAAVVPVAYVLPRAGLVPGAELQRGGAVSGHAAASVFFIDVNELRRAMAGGTAAISSRRGTSFYVRPVRSAFAAVVRADVVAFLRLQPVPVSALMWLGICVSVALLSPALPVLLQLAVVLVAGCSTTAGTGTVARRAAVILGLDSLVPVSAEVVQYSRILMPALAMAAWMAALTATFVALGPAPPSLVLLGVIAGVGMGAGAVRAASRPATDWTKPPVETPFGPVPGNQVSSLLRGTDVTVLTMTPVLLGLFLGAVEPWLILVQCILSVGAIIAHAKAFGDAMR